MNSFAPHEYALFKNLFDPKSSSETPSSRDTNMTSSSSYPQPHQILRKRTDDHPIDNIIGNLSRLVFTRRQLTTFALWCFYNSVLSKVEPKDVQTAISKYCWVNAMHDEVRKFDRLEVWEWVLSPDCAMIVALSGS